MASFLTKFYVSAILVMLTFVLGMALAETDEEGMHYIYVSVWGGSSDTVVFLARKHHHHHHHE